MNGSEESSRSRKWLKWFTSTYPVMMSHTWWWRWWWLWCELKVARSVGLIKLGVGASGKQEVIGKISTWLNHVLVTHLVLSREQSQ